MTQTPLAQVAPEGDVYLAAFGEGGELANTWLGDPRVKGYYCADALPAVDPRELLPATVPAADQALLDFVVKAAADPRRRAVVTVGTSGSVRVAQMATEAELRGVVWAQHHPIAEVVRMGTLEVLTPDRRSLEFGKARLPPARMWTCGGASLIDFGDSLSRDEQLTQAAPVLWPSLFVRGPKPRKTQARQLLWGAAILGAGALVVVALTKFGERNQAMEVQR